MTDPERSARHWADVAAEEAMAGGRREHVVSSGISPSGEIHIGNMREVLTADAVYRALRDGGAQVRFNYIADNFDPLRKVYPFLDDEVYRPLIGRPLSEIRCPCGGHDSYSDHYLGPFLDALRRLHVDVEVERADRMYKSGRMNRWIVRALERRDQLAAILHELTGKEVAPDWSPFNPLCTSCGRITQAKVVDFSAEAETVEFRCACGAQECVPLAGGGKLVWRIDWPARWMMLGVTVEPFGKDHATRGGSFDTGRRIVREIFDGVEPHPIPYEWIRLKGRGDMSSSKGNVLSISRILDVVPPEALRFLVFRERPQKTINFDPGVPLLRLVDEMEERASTAPDDRALSLSLGAGFRTAGVPFKHLVVVAQAARFDLEKGMEILARTGYAGADATAVGEHLVYLERWLSEFGPEEMRFEVQERLPPEVAGLGAEQRSFLGRLAAVLEDGLDGEQVHARIYEVAGTFEGIKPASLFQAIYVALLGKQRGPRAGYFLALLGSAFCATRFREAAEEQR